MGKNLFIRVSAATYDEAQVASTWPTLCTLAWPEKYGTQSTILPQTRVTYGVLELAAKLADLVKFGDLPEPLKEELTEKAAVLETLQQKMEQALGNRDVATAHSLTNEFEDTLDEMETIAKAANT